MLMVAPRRALEFGLLLGALGALMIAVGVIMFLRHPDEGSAYRQRWWTLVGAVSIGLGFIVQLVGQLAR